MFTTATPGDPVLDQIAGNATALAAVLVGTTRSAIDLSGDALASAIDAATGAVDAVTAGRASAVTSVLDTVVFGSLSKAVDTARAFTSTVAS